jgi:hypothetical protein
MKALLRSSIVCLLSGMLVAQSTSTSQSTASTKPRSAAAHRRAATAAKATGPSTAEQLRELREMLQNQQQQIQSLQNQLATRDQQVQQAQQAATQAQSQAADASSKATQAQSTQADTATQVAALSTTVKDVKQNDQNLSETIQTEQKRIGEVENPPAIRFKGITISPTGTYFAAETVYRTRGMGADINTQFSGIPFSGAPNAHLSEFNATGRQTRIAFLAEGKVSSYTARAYFESDFLSAGVTSNDNQSNSYSLRQRQVWGQVETDSGWTLTGGQQFTLATENRSGLSNRTEVLPGTIDPQYNAGYTWARQYGMRLTKSFNKKFWVGGSIEAPQTLNVGGGGLPFTEVFQQVGNTGGLYNNQANYSYNQAPDLIGKVALEPGYGHYEVFGIMRFFRNRIYPNALGTSTSAAGVFNDSKTAGGLGANARFSLVPKKVELGLHVLAGAGVGRYGDSTLSDVTFRPDGSLEPLRGGSALLSLELNPTPKLNVYAYYGGDYAERALYNAVIAGKPTLIGYGRTTNVTTGCGIEVAPAAAAGNSILATATSSPANCSPDTRMIQEGTAGYWYDFYRGPKGRIRQGIQYSYLEKNTWRGTGGSPKAIDNMVFTSFRYYLP